MNLKNFIMILGIWERQKQNKTKAKTKQKQDPFTKDLNLGPGWYANSPAFVVKYFSKFWETGSHFPCKG